MEESLINLFIRKGIRYLRHMGTTPLSACLLMEMNRRGKTRRNTWVSFSLTGKQKITGEFIPLQPDGRQFLKMIITLHLNQGSSTGEKGLRALLTVSLPRQCL